MKLLNFIKEKIKELIAEERQLIYMDNKKYEIIYPKLPKLEGNVIPTYDRVEFEKVVEMDNMIPIILPKTLTRDEALNYFNELGGVKRFVVFLHEVDS